MKKILLTLLVALTVFCGCSVLPYSKENWIYTNLTTDSQRLLILPGYSPVPMRPEIGCSLVKDKDFEKVGTKGYGVWHISGGVIQRKVHQSTIWHIQFAVGNPLDSPALVEVTVHQPDKDMFKYYPDFSSLSSSQINKIVSVDIEQLGIPLQPHTIGYFWVNVNLPTDEDINNFIFMVGIWNKGQQGFGQISWDAKVVFRTN